MKDTKPDPAARDEDQGSPGEISRGVQRRPAWVAVFAVVIALVVGAFLGFRLDWGSPGPGEPGVAGEDGSAPGGGTGGSDAVAPGPHIRGKILLEKPAEAQPTSTQDGDDDTSGAGSGAQARAAPDPVVDLIAPPLGTCVVIPWQLGRAVGPPATCAEDGGFELVLDGGVTGTVAVEMSIPGRLRGLVEVEVPMPAGGELPTVALGFGVPLSGRVVDGRGEGLAGVTVQAMPVPNLGESEPWRARSGSDGSFRFETLPHGRVNLRAVKEGFAMSVVETIAPERDVLVTLDGLVDLRGEVVADPALLARARVRIEGSSLWPPIERALGEEGREGGEFLIEGLPDGIYGVEIVVPPIAGDPREWASVPLENITPDLRVSVALIEAHRVPVKVVDPDGDAVIGARVTLGYSSIGLLQKQALTDVEGRARVGPVVPGPYLVWADADGFLPAKPVEIRMTDRPPNEQVLTLARPARIEGTVVDEEDRGVPGASVSLDGEGALSFGESGTRAQIFGLRASAGGSLGTTLSVPDLPRFVDGDDIPTGVVTDDAGRFSIPMLWPGTYHLAAHHGGHAASASLRVELGSGELRAGIRLRLRQGTALTGVVRTSNGQPVPHAQLEFDDGLVLVADERGVFDAGLRRGRGRVVVRARGMVPRAIDFRVGASPLDLDVSMEEAQGRVEGRVRGSNDQPVEDAEVNLRILDGLSPSAIEWSDGRGLFVFEDLATGPARLDVHHADYVDAIVEMRASRSGAPVEIVLDAGWMLEVGVRSMLRGDPIRGARIHAGPRSGRSDAAGLLILEHLGGETVEVEVQAQGWTSARIRARREAGNVTRIEVELEEAGSVEGRVTDERGEPVVGASILLRQPPATEQGAPRGDVVGEVRSGAGGVFEVSGLPPGSLVVEVEPPSVLSAVLAPITAEIDVRRGLRTSGVDLRFERL